MEGAPFRTLVIDGVPPQPHARAGGGRRGRRVRADDRARGASPDGRRRRAVPGRQPPRFQGAFASLAPRRKTVTSTSTSRTCWAMADAFVGSMFSSMGAGVTAPDPGGADVIRNARNDEAAAELNSRGYAAAEAGDTAEALAPVPGGPSGRSDRLGGDVQHRSHERHTRRRGKASIEWLGRGRRSRVLRTRQDLPRRRPGERARPRAVRGDRVDGAQPRRR